MSVPVPLSSLGHAPVQMSRSVPAYPRHSPGCPAHTDLHGQGHRKLTRSGPGVSPGEMQRMQRVRRERARSASALRPDLQHHHGAKRRKQEDHNR